MFCETGRMNGIIRFIRIRPISLCKKPKSVNDIVINMILSFNDHFELKWYFDRRDKRWYRWRSLFWNFDRKCKIQFETTEILRTDRMPLFMTHFNGLSSISFSLLLLLCLYRQTIVQTFTQQHRKKTKVHTNRIGRPHREMQSDEKRNRICLKILIRIWATCSLTQYLNTIYRLYSRVRSQTVSKVRGHQCNKVAEPTKKYRIQMRSCWMKWMANRMMAMKAFRVNALFTFRPCQMLHVACLDVVWRRHHSKLLHFFFHLSHTTEQPDSLF